MVVVTCFVMCVCVFGGFVMCVCVSFMYIYSYLLLVQGLLPLSENSIAINNNNNNNVKNNIGGTCST